MCLSRMNSLLKLVSRVLVTICCGPPPIIMSLYLTLIDRIVMFYN